MRVVISVDETSTIFSSYFESIGVHVEDLDSVIAGYRERKEFNLIHHFNEVVQLKEGVIEFLIKAKELGKKLAVGTSTRRVFAALILKQSGLENYFDSIVAVEDVAHTKPSPEIFLEALRQIGGTKLDAVIFEDSNNGVQSAVNTGIDFYVLRNKGKNDEVTARYPNVITSYRELLSLLE